MPISRWKVISSDANVEGVRIKRAFGIVLLALILFYIGDDLSARLGLPGHRPTFGTVRVRRQIDVPQKNKKTEFYFEPPEDQACVNALFPHFGVQPCWYLNRHKNIKVNM
jgi:hypothetical protein